MESIFYFKSASSNKKEGPFTFYQIFQFIFQNQLCPQSLLYNQKDQEWKPIDQRFCFKNFFSSDLKCQWTLLKKYQDQFIQSGCYSKKGLQILLSRGWISDQDFVWREGYSSWQRLSICQEFHTRLDHKIEDLMDQKSTQDSSLNAARVFRYQREKLDDSALLLAHIFKWKK